MPTSQKTLPKSPGPEEDARALDALWEKEVAARKLPALAVGVVKEGKLVWHRGFGETKAGEPVSLESVFRLGSVTKVFTALALLQLRDEGKLRLSDPAAKHLPELKEALSPPGQPPVTLLHLITHSSGVPTLGDGTLDWTKGEPITEEALIKSVQKATLEFPPGSRFAYSNVGVALAGLVVARVSGLPYREHLDTHLLKPLGMTHSSWEPGANPLLVPGHLREADGYRPADFSWRLGAIDPAGGLYTTLEDMALFVAWQMGSVGPAEGDPWFARSTLKEAQKPALKEGHPTGLGWMISQVPDLGQLVWHNGSTMDYGAWVGLLPERDLGVIILSATGDLTVMGRLELLAAETLRIAAHVKPAASPQEKPPTVPTPKALTDAVLDKVKGLLTNPERDYEEIFNPAYLTSQPAEQLKEFFTQVAQKTGACTTFEVLKDEGKGAFEAKLFCANTNLHLKIKAEEAPPHLIEGILIRFAL